MSVNWIQRALAQAKKMGLSVKDINRAVSETSTIMQDVQGKKQSVPSIENFAKIARRLNMTVGELYDGEKSVPVTIAVHGTVRGGEMWNALAKNEKREVPLSFFDHDLVAIEITTSELQPSYRVGDVLVGTRRVGKNFDNLIGRDCICETTTGERYIKYLIRGRTVGTYALRSFAPTIPDVEGVKLAWVAPIEMVLRGLS